MKDSYEQRIQKRAISELNEARHIQREYARLRDQEKIPGRADSFRAGADRRMGTGTLWDEHVFDVQGTPGCRERQHSGRRLSAAAERQAGCDPAVSYFLDMTDREISEKLNIVHQTVSKRRRTTLKELRKYLVKEGFEMAGRVKPIPFL